MKKLFFIFGILMLLITNIACRQNDQVADEYRNNLDLKTELKQKEIFSNLDTNSKIRFWKSKLDQIKNENITSEQRMLINNLSDEISKLNDVNYDGIKLFEYAIQIAKITPDDEFIRMFSVIGDYSRNQNLYNNKKVSNSNIALDLEGYVTKLKANKNSFYANRSSSTARRPTCNCRWTCGFYTSVTNDNCDSSVSGCGFLWIQECTGYV